MYLLAGANLHGQWFQNKPVLNEFEKITQISNFDLDEMKLLHISWSYNLYQIKNKFYLSGSWYGNKNQVIQLHLPEEVRDPRKTQLLLIGNDYSLFLYDVNLQTMWVISLENETGLTRINLNTETCVGAAKRLKTEDPIIKACATNFNNLCMTSQGRVYSGMLPSPLDTSKCIGKICDIQCGYEHCLLLTEAGLVYSWGNGRRLQLGHGNLNHIEAPTQVEALAGIHIVQISAGGWHSLALSEFGDVYAWGWNDTGQLGIKETQNSETHVNSVNSYGVPTLIDIYNENGVIINTDAKSIACGSRHSAILLEDNSVWTTGCNKYGQIGFDSERIEKVLTFRKSYQCSGISSIRCGPWVTVIMNDTLV